MDRYVSKLCALVEELLADAEIRYHSVSGRVKGFESASDKLARNPDRYEAFEDLHDLIGIRVITYFPEEVDQVAEVLEPEFVVDTDNSVDKRALLDPDRVGYLSLHYVMTLGPDRGHLVEYRRFTSVSFELQIRSILQHAWAEIEHDLGYKSDGALPRDLRRRFSRLAGLLEVADDEFSALRAAQARYRETVLERISRAPEALPLDQDTMFALLEESPQLNALDKEVASVWPAEIASEPDERYAASRARGLKHFHIEDVQQVLMVSESLKRHAIEFARLWVNPIGAHGRRRVPLQRGIGLFYIEYVLIAKYGNPYNSKALEVRLDRARRGSTLRGEVQDCWAQVVEVLGEPPEVLNPK
jgi:putative GTP pyrophosphokinase